MSDLTQILIDELKPFPGRMNLALRCVSAAAVVVLATMTLQVPYLAVSLIAVFYVTQSNVVLTKLTGIVFVIGVTLAVCLSILLLKFTFDYPLLRIVLASVIFFCCVYAIRIFKIGIAFFLAALVTIYVQSFVDVTDNAEALVRGVLWVWVAVSYPIALALLINTLLLPLEPRRQLAELMVSKLGAVQAILDAVSRGGTRPLNATPAQVENTIASLQKLLRFAAMRGNRNAESEARDLANITAVSSLYAAIANWGRSFEVSEPTREFASTARLACDSLSKAISEDVPFSISGAPLWTALRSGAALSLHWEAKEIARVLLELDAFNAARHDVLYRPPASPMIVPDAWKNPAYVQYALKTSLAVLACYVFYNSVQWQGIHTVMLTCLVVAQPSLGASGRRSLLRFCGAAVGSLLALFTIVFVLPRIDGIAALLVTVIPVFFAGAWVAAGSERLSYAGVQIMFTFSLAFLEQFAPTFDLTEIRDRMVGIFLGIAVATFVQMTFWPEGEAAELRQRLAKCIRAIADLLDERDGSRIDGWQDVEKRRAAAWLALSDCEGMLLRVALEPTWREAEEECVTLRANEVLAACRSVLMTVCALQAASRMTDEAQDRGFRDHRLMFEAEAISVLKDYADRLAQPIPSARVRALSSARLSASNGDERTQDVLIEMDRLTQVICSLPAWVGSTESFVPTLSAQASHE